MIMPRFFTHWEFQHALVAYGDERKEITLEYD